jgi:hypothetical protein
MKENIKFFLVQLLVNVTILSFGVWGFYIFIFNDNFLTVLIVAFISLFITGIGLEVMRRNEYSWAIRGRLVIALILTSPAAMVYGLIEFFALALIGRVYLQHIWLHFQWYSLFYLVLVLIVTLVTTWPLKGEK